MARKKMPEAWANLKMWRVNGALMSFNDFRAKKAQDNRSRAQRWRRDIERAAREFGKPVAEVRTLARERLRTLCEEKLRELGELK